MMRTDAGLGLGLGLGAVKCLGRLILGEYFYSECAVFIQWFVTDLLKIVLPKTN
jgi:hypothetical protein